MGVRVVEPAAIAVNIPQEAEPDKPGAGGHLVEEGIVLGEGSIHRVNGGADLNG